MPLTWAAQREHAAQVIRGVESHKAAAAFLSGTFSASSAALLPSVLTSAAARTLVRTVRSGFGGQRDRPSNGRTGWGPGGFVISHTGTGVNHGGLQADFLSRRFIGGNVQPNSRTGLGSLADSQADRLSVGFAGGGYNRGPTL